MRTARAILRWLLAAKGRFAGIAVLVAVSVCVYAGTGAGLARVAATVEGIYRDQALFDLELRFEPEERITVSSEEEIRERAPQIAEADWRLLAAGNVEFNGGNAGLFLTGVDHARAPQVSQVRITQGKGLDPREPEKVVIDATFAEARGLKLGDPLQLRVHGFELDARVGGLGVFPELLVASMDEHMMLPVKGSVAGALVGSRLLKRVIGGFPVNSLAVKFRAAPGASEARGPIAIAGGVRDSGSAARDLPRVARDAGPAVGESSRDATVAGILAALAGDDLRPAGHTWPENQFSVASNRARLTTFARFLPTVVFVFMGLTFLVLLLLSQKIIRDWSKEIATIRAFGAGRWSLVGSWMLGLSIPVLVGAAIGAAGAAWLAQAVSRSYQTGMGLPLLYPYFGWRPWVESVALCWLAVVPAVLIPVWPAVSELPSRLLRGVGAKGCGREIGIGFAPFPERIGFNHVLRKPLGTLVSAASIAGSLVVSSCMYLFAQGSEEGFRRFLDANRWSALVQFNQSGNGTDFFRQALDEARVAEIFGEAGVADWEPVYTAEGAVLSGPHALAQTLTAYAPGTRLHGPGGLVTGKMPEADSEAAVDLKTSQRLGRKVGDWIRLRAGSRETELRLVGIMNSFTINQVFLSRDGLKRVTGEEPRFTRAVIGGPAAGKVRGARLEPALERAIEVLSRRSEVARVVPASILIASASESNGILTGFVRTYGHLGALVGMVVILVVIGLNVAERSSDYAILRAVGFTRGEIARGLLSEILALAATAALIAYPASLAAAGLLQREIATISNWVPIDSGPLNWAVLALPAFGILLFSLIPAMRLVYAASEAESLRVRAAG